MFCPNCGQQIADGAKFCMNCGQSLQDAAAATAPADNYPSTTEEKFYEMVMKEHVCSYLKNPSDAVWPRFSEDMVTEYGTFSKKPCILTEMDATNSYGGKLRMVVRIKLKHGYEAYSGFGMKNAGEAIFVEYDAFH